jgi:hypothetical protein
MSWTKDNQQSLGVLFIVCVCLGIIVDLVLVLVLGDESISYRTWIAQQEHPTLITAGAFATIGVCYLVRTEWRLVLVAAFLGGHLFAHW